MAVTLLVPASTWAQLPPPPVSPSPSLRYEYDARGSQTARVTAPGVGAHESVVRRTFDGLARLRAEMDPLGATVSLAYDGRDDAVEVRDPRLLSTTMLRDGLGRARQLVSPDTGSTMFIQDAAGNTRSSTDARGATVTREFDALNRLLSAAYQMPGGPPLSLGWRYDETGPEFGYSVGRLTTQSYPGGSRRYGYDSHGRIVRTTQTEDQGDMGPPVSYMVSYAYDIAGQVSSITYPSGRTVHFRREAGLVSAVEWSSGTSSRTALLSGLRFEPFGAPRSWGWHLSSGIQPHIREFDSAGRLVRYPLGTTVRDVLYDPAGRIRSYTHLDRTSGASTSSTRALDQTFAYDRAGRLIDVVAAGTGWGVAYDASGNRVLMRSGSVIRPVTVDSGSNRFLALANPARSFSHDTAGSVVGDKQWPAQWTGSYDARGRVERTRATGDGTRFVETTYRHDTDGRRTTKTVVQRQVCTAIGTFTACTSFPPLEGPTHYIHAITGQLIGEYSASQHSEYIWLDTMPVAMLRASAPGWQPQVYYIHADHLDTPRVVTDTQGRLRWAWLAEPFGHMLPNEDPQGLGRFVLNLRMPGQYYDSETGLLQNHHREYDSSLGRYTQSDPIGLAGGINTYAYVEGNPVSNIDPLGLETYICRRPLGGAPGSFAPPLFNHRYVCVGSGSNMICGSTTASSGGVLSSLLKGSPGAPTTSAKDYFKPEACERRQGEDSCIETCIANALRNPKRPKYGIGPAGADCQEYTEDVVSTCEKRCGRR